MKIRLILIVLLLAIITLPLMVMDPHGACR